MNSRPNIVLFLTDDHGAWALGCAGRNELQTQNLDRLAREGVRFANAFTPSPVCSPARACLLTGRTPSQVGIHDWLQEWIPEIGDHDWLGDTPTLFDHFDAAGYRTALCGKWHLGRSHRRPRGCHEHFGLPRNQSAHNERYTYVHNDHELTLEGNKTGHITDHALAFLRSAGSDRPFFLNVGYVATHSPYVTAAHDPELVALYRDASFADLPPYRPHPWGKNEGGPLDAGITPEFVRDTRIGYYAAVTEIDRAVGRIVAELEQSGRLENTVILYTSDHGCALGHHGFWGKGNSTRPLNMYDTSLRVPLLMLDGRAPHGGRVVERCVDHYDTFRALCELAKLAPANAPTDDALDRSWLPLLADDAAAWDDVCFGEYGDLRMIRTPEWKWVQRYPHGPYELYDLIRDPDETLNLAGWEAHRAVQAELTSRLQAWSARYDVPECSGLRVKSLPRHNEHEAWRDGRRERRGLQVY